MSGVAHAKQDEYLGLVAAGYVMAFVLPIGGLVMAFVLSERRTGHAAVMAVLSVFAVLAWTRLIWG